MVLAISFLEAPLKFGTPGLDLKVGLAMGRIVFRALNIAECVWLTVIAVSVAIAGPPARITVLAAATGVVLLVQLGLVRPRLTHRSNRILAGYNEPRSSTHHWYVLLEVTKVAALISLGVCLFSA